MNHFLMKIKQSDTSNYESAVVALLHPLKMQFRKKKNPYKPNERPWFREYMTTFVLKCVLSDSLLIQKI